MQNDSNHHTKSRPQKITGPTDYLLKLDITEIGLLDEVAFETIPAKITASAYSLCFWFYTYTQAGTRVIANIGNKTTDESGWTVYLQDLNLIFRVNSQEKNITLADSDRWHHFAASVDLVDDQITVYLDGVKQNRLLQKAQEWVEAGSVATSDRLIIGGYTDSAGGHFNYRFGGFDSGFVDDFRLYARVLSDQEWAPFARPDNESLIADFKFEPNNAEAPVAVNFNAQISQPLDDLITYLWDFGDGSSAQGISPTHEYAYADNYSVRLMVVDRQHTHAITQQTLRLTGTKNPLKPQPVFINGTEGYACFRIPAIIRTFNGDLLAFAEGRVADCSDATQVIHIVCKRSHDNGQTWQALQIVARNISGDAEFACMNPAPVVDSVHGTGRTIVVYNKMECSEWAITQGQGISRVFCIFSYDHGRSWTDEKDITLQVHKPYNPSYTEVYPQAAQPENQSADWRKQVPTLGHAIQLQSNPSQNSATKGRLFFIGSRSEGNESVFFTQNYAFWSDDLGETWQIGKEAISLRQDGSSAKGLGEATAVELEDGSVMINSRNYQNGTVVGQRAVTLGYFDEVGNIRFEPTRHDAGLIDSGVQASLIRTTYRAKNILLFANPDHPQTRIRMTIRISFDEAKTWPVTKLVDSGPSAYSDLVIQHDGHIGLLYEQGNHGGIAYVSFAFEFLLENQIITAGGE